MGINRDLDLRNIHNQVVSLAIRLRGTSNVVSKDEGSKGPGRRTLSICGRFQVRLTHGRRCAAIFACSQGERVLRVSEA